MRKLWLLAPLVAALVAAGCSDDDNPSNPGGDDALGTFWVTDGAYWHVRVDATSSSALTGYSFADKDTVPAPKAPPSPWDIAFRREVVKLNGGDSGSGDVEGADLGAADYAGVDAADSAAATWEPDAVQPFIEDWYTYNPQTHQFTLTQNVYSMLDASGDHFVKVRVDSLSGDLGPGSMGDVHLTYYYQPEEGSPNLPGPTQTAVISVGTGAGYFDFSSGTQVTPADPASSLEWDVKFENFTLAMNGGASGPGNAAGFWAYTTLGNEPSDIDAFTLQPSGAPLFSDTAGSALTDWYDYDDVTHILSSKNHVYLIRSAGRLYKLQILGYYAKQGGTSVSGIYSFKWNEI